MSWCEREGIGYVLGLARNTRLAEPVEEAMEWARKAHRHTKRAARRFVEFYLSHAHIVEPRAAGGGQGGIPAQRPQPAVCGDQPAAQSGPRQTPV